MFPNAKRYDLLLSDQYQRFLLQPSLIREECLAIDLKGENQISPVIIDEVQKIPILLDEIHWLIENINLRFILCGSSDRKVKRGRGNLLGGRAVRYELHPLVYPEIPDFSLERALNNGLLPRHYQSLHPHQLLQAYVGDYLKEEIAAEALTRNITAFSRFLQIAALTNGELINYNNIASECGGRALEHLIYMELTAHSSYSKVTYPIAYWKTASGFEVDFVLGEREISVEVKGTDRVTNRHLKGIRAFKEEYQARSNIVVSMDTTPRKTEDGIEILPWQVFLERLWNNEITNF